MLNRIYRIVAWICIIAHLNLIFSSIHGAYAMYPDDNQEMMSRATKNPAKIIPLDNPKPEDLFQEESQFNSRLSTFSTSDLWEKTTSLGSALWGSGIVPFIILASLIDGVNPLYYFLAYCAGSKLFETLDSPQVNRMVGSAKEHVTDRVKGTLKGVKATCQSIVSLRSSDIAMTYLTLFPFLFQLTGAAIQTLGINGGDNLNIPYETGGLTHYDNKTAPFLVGVEPDQMILTFLTHSLFVQRGFGEIQHVNSLHEYEVIKSIMNTKGNFTIKPGSYPLSILSTAENLKAFLMNLRFSAMDPNSYRHIFKFYKGTSASTSDTPLLSATRRFYHLETYNENNRVLSIVGGTLGGVGGFLFIGTVFFYLVNRFFNPSTHANTDNKEDNNGDVALTMLDSEDALDYKAFSQELEKITDPEVRQNIAWRAIQKLKGSLKDKDLFLLCNSIGAEYSCYDKAVEIQADCLDKMLQGDIIIDSFFKDSFLLKLSKVELNDMRRHEAICWQYIQKYEEGIRAKGVRVLFDMYNIFGLPFPKYSDILPLQAKCLMEILDQEPDAKSSIVIYQIMMNKELEKIVSLTHRQNVILNLISQSNLASEIKVNLCDQISADHPQYNQSLIHKANLIYGAVSLSDDERYEQAMRILIKIPDDEDAQGLMRTFFEQCYWGANLQGEMPEALRSFELKTENDLKVLNLFLQQKKESGLI